MQAPFQSTVMTVKPEWIDFNGHLNMAYYGVLFDLGADQMFDHFGFGPDYQTRTGNTTYTVEFHLSYVRELHVDDVVTVTFQLIDCDAKRFHSYQEIFHEDGWLAATGEAMSLHVDQSGPRVAPMPDDVFAKIEAFNPMGSVKDRLALGVIEDAEKRGALQPGQTVIEATSGNTGIGLAMVCARKGYPLVVTMAENFSGGRRRLLAVQNVGFLHRRTWGRQGTA